MKHHRLILNSKIALILGIAIALPIFAYYTPLSRHIEPIDSIDIIKLVEAIEAKKCPSPTWQEMDDEQLFANIMEQYWEKNVDSLWRQDKALREVISKEAAVVDRICGLKRDEKGNPLIIEKPTCYPWQVPYRNIDELFIGLKTNNQFSLRDKSYPDDFVNRMLSLNAKVYYPKTTDNIYHSSNINFGIIQKDASDTIFYPANCCKILDKYQLMSDKDYSAYFKSYNKEELSEYLNHPRFLKIVYYLFDSVQYDVGSDTGGIGKLLSSDDLTEEVFYSKDYIPKKYHPIFFRINNCNKLLYFQ